jgi:hypothetical protein
MGGMELSKDICFGERVGRFLWLAVNRRSAAEDDLTPRLILTQP